MLKYDNHLPCKNILPKLDWVVFCLILTLYKKLDITFTTRCSVMITCIFLLFLYFSFIRRGQDIKSLSYTHIICYII